MFFISHRGNLDGPNESKENHPDYINKALLEMEVEIDVWYKDSSFYLGHDKPTYKIDVGFLKKKLRWCGFFNCLSDFNLFTLVVFLFLCHFLIHHTGDTKAV